MSNKIFLKGAVAALFFIVILSATFLRPVRVTSDNSSKILILSIFDKGKSEFINSVTGAKVEITFSIKNRFENFYMNTDEKTENYYTSGLYNINDFLKKEKKTELNYCSIKGITVRLGKHKFNVKNNCLKVELLWSPNKIF